MKVALLLFGQPRNVHTLEVFNSHKKFIIDRYETDVYAHAWWDSEVKTYHQTEWGYRPINPIEVAENTDKIIIDNYKPVAYLFQKQEFLKFSDEVSGIVTDNLGFDKDDMKNKVLSQLLTIEEVGKLFLKSKGGRFYDFVVLARYDIVFEHFPNLNELEKGKFYVSNSHPRFPDLCFFFDEKFIKFTELYSHVESNIRSIDKSLFKSETFWEFSPEAIKFTQFRLNFDMGDLRKFQIREHRAQS